MTEKKPQVKTVRLTHSNGATVVVPADKEEALVNGGLFSRPQSSTSGSSRTSSK